MNSSDLDYIRAFKSEVISSENQQAKEIIFDDAFKAGRLWYSKLRRADTDKPDNTLKKECKSYIKSNAKFSNKPSGFIPSFIWWIIAKAIINWIVNRIINHIATNDRR